MNYNPYVAPQAAPPPPGMPGMPPGGGGAAQPWAVGEMLSAGWNAVKVNFVPLVLGFFIAYLIYGIPGWIAGGVAQSMVQSDPNNAMAAQGVTHAGSFVTWILSSFFQVGLIRIYCAAARGQQASLGMIFSGFDRFGAMLAASFLMGLAFVVGLMLCIVPGILLMIALSLTPYYVVDARMGPIEAMQQSWATTKGQWGSIFLYWLAGFAICIAAALVCVLPVFAAWPMVCTGFALAYMRMTGRVGAEPAGAAMPMGAFGAAPAGYGAPPAGGFGGGPGFGPPGGAPPGGFGGPPGAPPGGGYGPPGGGGGGYGPPGGGMPPGGGYGPPGGGGYGPPGGGGYGR